MAKLGLETEYRSVHVSRAVHNCPAQNNRTPTSRSSRGLGEETRGGEGTPSNSLESFSGQSWKLEPQRID